MIKQLHVRALQTTISAECDFSLHRQLIFSTGMSSAYFHWYAFVLYSSLP